MSDKPYFSPSQLDMFARCAEQYRRRYVEREILPPGIAAIRGISIHQTAANNFQQKLTTGRDLPTADMIDMAVEQFRASLHGGYLLNPDEQSRGYRAVISETAAEVADMAQVHADEQAPDYQPHMIEQTIRIELPGPRDLLGVIDLADTRGFVVDFKTTKRAKTQATADASTQLTVYSAAYMAVAGRFPRLLVLDSIVQTDTSTRRHRLTTQRDQSSYVALANRIKSTQRAIDAGSFPPADPDHWLCNPKWCGYYHTCSYVAHGCRRQND